MAITPIRRKILAEATARYQASHEPDFGIIPLDPPDPRDALIYEVATLISEAATGPAISAVELAEMIADTVMEAA